MSAKRPSTPFAIDCFFSEIASPSPSASLSSSRPVLKLKSLMLDSVFESDDLLSLSSLSLTILFWLRMGLMLNFGNFFFGDRGPGVEVTFPFSCNPLCFAESSLTFMMVFSDSLNDSSLFLKGRIQPFYKTVASLE